jgi:uridine kinase
MARWAPERRDTIRALAEELLQNYAHGRVIVAVDGADATISGPFADDLAVELRALDHDTFRASMADFLQPRVRREVRGADSALGFYEDAYDYSAFRRVLLGPFRLAGSTGFSTAFFDAKRDVPFESKWETGPADAVLVVDGQFLLRPELKGIWNFSVRLDSTAGEAVEQAAEPPREAGAEALYEREAGPRAAASAIVNVVDPEHPRRVFADSC